MSPEGWKEDVFLQVLKTWKDLENKSRYKGPQLAQLQMAFGSWYNYINMYYCKLIIASYYCTTLLHHNLRCPPHGCFLGFGVISGYGARTWKWLQKMKILTPTKLYSKIFNVIVTEYVGVKYVMLLWQNI